MEFNTIALFITLWAELGILSLVFWESMIIHNIYPILEERYFNENREDFLENYKEFSLKKPSLLSSFKEATETPSFVGVLSSAVCGPVDFFIGLITYFAMKHNAITKPL